jgi:hypothetical protein
VMDDDQEKVAAAVHDDQGLPTRGDRTYFTPASPTLCCGYPVNTSRLPTLCGEHCAAALGLRPVLGQGGRGRQSQPTAKQAVRVNCMKIAHQCLGWVACWRPTRSKQQSSDGKVSQEQSV